MIEKTRYLKASWMEFKDPEGTVIALCSLIRSEDIMEGINLLYLLYRIPRRILYRKEIAA